MILRGLPSIYSPRDRTFKFIHRFNMVVHLATCLLALEITLVFLNIALTSIFFKNWMDDDVPQWEDC